MLKNSRRGIERRISKYVSAVKNERDLQKSELNRRKENKKSNQIKNRCFELTIEWVLKRRGSAVD